MFLDNATRFDTQMNMSFDRAGHEVVVVAVKGSFDFPERPGDPCRVSQVQEPLLLADVFGPDPAADATIFENDFAPFKPRCDVLVHGAAISPDRRPVTRLVAGVRVGGWSKVVEVHGQRIWLKSALGFRISDPRPFASRKISYDLAWGGVDPDPSDPSRATTFEENPAGVGFYPKRQDLEGAPLPATSEPGRIVKDRVGAYRPMAFGPLGRSWLPRRLHAGTYDEAWLEERMPFLPDDFDNQYYQAAPPDQQIAYPRGGEPIELVHLTPGGRMRSWLPTDRIAVTFVRKRGAVTQKLANVDTVLVLADEGKLCLTWRAQFVTERDIHELREILVRDAGEVSA